LLGRKTTKEGEKTLSQNNQFENKFEYGIFWLKAGEVLNTTLNIHNTFCHKSIR
jgi:hypothetical protein